MTNISLKSMAAVSSICCNTSIRDNRIYSILAIGQSNMAGRGSLMEVSAINNPKCHMLRMGRWQPLSDPVNVDRRITPGSFSSGVGPMASFADMMNQQTGRQIGIIPCADGGTKICQWQPGEVLYDHAVFMTQLAMRSSVFSGIIWHQGESDARSTKPEDYYVSLCRMVETIRQDLHAQSLPFVMGRLSDKIGKSWNIPLDGIYGINEQIDRCAAKYEKMSVVDVSDLELQSDEVHFSAASARVLGKRYAEAFLSLI